MKRNSLIVLLTLAVLLSACNAFPSVTDVPVPTDASRPTDDGSVQLSIENTTDSPLDVFWVDNGQEQPYGSVAAGDIFTIITYPDHLWRISDPAGNLILEYTVTTFMEQTVTITSEMLFVDTTTPCRLASNGDVVGAGFPVNSYRMPSTGMVKVPVLFTDFPDAPATRTPENILSIISPGAPDFYRTVSYGLLDLQLVPYLQWLRMSKPSSEYDFTTYDGQLAYIQEAVTLADPEVDFSDAASVYILANPDATSLTYGPAFTGAPDWGGFSADGTIIYNAATSGNDLEAWGYLWLNHEANHTMGLPDLYAYQYDTNNYADLHRFVGDFDIMGFIGGKAPELLAFQRWQLGWLDDSQIVCQQVAETTTTLSPIETSYGVKAVIVPTGPQTAVVIESRRPLGYDSNLFKSGALVYTVDTAIYSGEGIYNVLPVSSGDLYRDQSPLGPGESLTVGSVTITVVASDENGDTVLVTVKP